MSDAIIAQAIASSNYFDHAVGCKVVKLLPNEFYVTKEDVGLVTVLGSCVAACIRDPHLGLGGMNHFMLPEEADGTKPTSASMRYGSYAMEVLVNQLIKAGARRDRLEAKVFGGGAVLPGMNSVNVGERNAAFVLRYLQMENIPIAAKDLMGDYPRKIYYFPRTGRALMKKMRTGQDIADQERDVIKKMRSGNVGSGTVELFSKASRQPVGASVNLWGDSGAGATKAKVELFNVPVRKS